MDRVMGRFAQRFPVRCARVRLACCQVRRIAFTAKGSLLSVESGLFSLRPFAGACVTLFTALYTYPCHLPDLFHSGAIPGVLPFRV